MKFDAYDYIGVIAPGAILVLTLSLLYPTLLPALSGTMSVGDLGLMLILAFVAGHLLQAAGNLWESIVWGVGGGMPTSWAAKSETRLLTHKQLGRLQERLQKDFRCDRSALSDGRGPLREINVRIRHNGKPDRIEKFNRNYGLMRGIAAAFIISSALVIYEAVSHWPIALLLLAVGLLASVRMVRFGEHYAREIYAEYLNLPDKAESTDSSAPQPSTT